MKTFKMTFIVPTELVGTFFELLNTDAELLSLEPYNAKDAKRHHKRIIHDRFKPAAALAAQANGPGRGRGGRPMPKAKIDPRFPRGEDVLLEALRTGPKTDAQLRNLFEGQGRNGNSVSPLLSRFVVAGKIQRGENRAWGLKPGA